MADESVKIRIELADKAAEKALGSFAKQVGTTNKDIKRLGKSGSNTFKEISVGIGKSIGVFDIFAGNVAANIVTGAFDQMFGAANRLFNTFVVDGVRAAQVQEDAVNNLNTQLALAGNFSEEASKDMQAFASEMQRTSKVGDETTLGLLALATTFGKSNEETKRLTQAAIELSAATGISLEGAVKNLGKTYAGLTGELGESLPIVKSLTKEQLQAGEAIDLILNRFGGSAAGQIRTFSGAVAQTTNTFGDLQETIGGLITQNPAIIAALNTVSNIMNRGIDGIKDQNTAYKSLVSEGFIGMIQAAGFVTAALDVLGRTGQAAFLVIWKTANDAALGINAVLGIFTDTSDAMAEQFAASKKAAEDFEKVFEKDTSLSKLGTALAEIEQNARSAFDKMQDGADRSVSSVTDSSGAVAALKTELSAADKALQSFAVNLVKQSESTQEQANLQLELLRAQKEQELITEEEFEARRQEIIAQRFVTENEQLQMALDQKLVTEEQYIAARDQLANKFAADQAKAEANAFKERQKTKTAQNQWEKKTEDEKREYMLASTASMFGGFAALAATGGKKMFEITRALSLAEAITAGILAVQKAAASAIPPFNIPAIAGATAFAAANVLRISQQRPPAFEQGGIVGGSSFSGDHITARVNSGEMILNRTQQRNLFDIANNGGNSEEISNLRTQVGNLARSVATLASQRLAIEIDGKEIINVTRSELMAGRTFA